jgi:hypothetical protein
MPSHALNKRRKTQMIDNFGMKRQVTIAAARRA